MTCFFTGCIDFIEGFYLFIILTVIRYAIYGPIFPLKLHIRFAVIFIIDTIICIISYYYVRERRKFYGSNYINEKSLKWSRSVIENINSGFISIVNSKVNYVNKSFISLLMKDKTRNLFSSNTFLNGDEDRNILNENYSLLYDISNCKLTLILQNLFEGIIFKENNIKIEDKSNYESAIDYLNKNVENENFECLGSKCIDVRGRDIQEYYEIFGRCYKLEKGEETYEFIFNDITKIKLDEEINADFKYKKIFLSKVAHEFKNPLICISELIDQISDNVANFNSEVNLDYACILNLKEILLHVKHMSDYLIILIKDMDFFSLTFSETKSQIKLEKEMVKLKDILSFCKNVTTTLLKKYLKEQSIEFYLECNNLPEKIYTDDTRLKQLLINLLSNSVKYTDFGSISLKVEGIQDKLRFEVRDTGKGLTEAQQMRLIGKDESYREITKHGSGFGLSIVKNILNLFESKIEYETYENRGSVFSFIIDASSQSNQGSVQENLIIQDANENNQMIVENPFPTSNNSNSSIITLKKEFIPSKINIIRSQCEINKTELPSVCDHDKSSKMIVKSDAIYIMVVDDETTTRKSGVRLLNNYFESLKKTNIVIIEAADGIECLFLYYEYLQKGVNLSFILSDETMNYLNGSLCAKILSEINTAKEKRAVPFFILTAYENFDSDIRNGITKAYTKPLSRKFIVDIMNQIEFKFE